MNKITTAALAGLVAVTASATASVSRWNGFGAANAYIADVQDIWTLPGVVASNKNTMYLEFGKAATPNTAAGVSNNPSNAWAGVHSEVGPGVLGVWVNRPQNSMVDALSSSVVFAAAGGLTMTTVNSLVGVTPADLSAKELNKAAGANGRVDVLYGLSLNETLDLGVLISRANRNGKIENVGNTSGSVDTYDANALGFGIGAEIKEVAIFKLVEVGFNYDSDGILLSTKTSSTENKQEHSVTLMSIRIGGDVVGDEGKFGRLEIGFTSGSSNGKNTPQVAAATGQKEKKTSGSKWNLGYAMGKSGDKGMGLMGLMLNGQGSESSTDATNSKSDNSELDLLLTAAGEAKIKEWLTARAGFESKIFQTKTANGAGATNPTKTTTSNNGAATLSTGLSLNLGSVVIDGVLNQDVLYTGSFLISGVAESLFGQVSATWAW